MAQTVGKAYIQVLPDSRSINNFHREVQSRIGSIKLNVDQSKGAFAPLGKISADLNQFQNSLDASVARTLAFGASVGVIGGAVRSIRAVIQSFVEVEKAVADINAVFKLTAPELKGFTSGLFDVARSTAQSFDDVAKAATEFSRQGLSVGETLKRTESAMKLVRLAGLETTQAVSVLTAAINGFSSAGLESAEIVNKLATVDAAYAVSSSDLALALSRAGDTAQGAKVSFDELLGAVTAVQQRTARGGAVIGNGLKSIFTRLQRSKVQGALEDVGVATKDADGNIRESMLILKDYAAVYNTLSDSQRAYTDEQIAGVYQINTLKALVRDLTNEYGVYNGAVRTSTEATDEAEKRMAALSQTTDAKIKRMSATFDEFASVGGEKVFKPVMDRLLARPQYFLEQITQTMKDGNGFWGTLSSGFAEGAGAFLAGPGLIKGVTVAVKLIKFLGGEALKAAQQIGAINTPAQKRIELEQRVLGLLQTDGELVAKIANGTLNSANAHGLVEKSLAKQLQLTERIAAFQKNVSSFVASNPAIIANHAQQFGVKQPRRLASGYAPALRKEKQAISQGVGGARSGDQPVVIPEFNYGGGKRGPAVAHTGEWFVPHFNGGSAIFNRDMAESYGLPSGAVRVGMAGGHIPNFVPPKTVVLGKGAFGEFHKYIRRPQIGYKKLFSEDFVRREWEGSKAAYEKLRENPFVGAPYVFGNTPEASIRRGRVGKQVVGQTLTNLKDTLGLKWEENEIINRLGSAAYRSARKSGVYVSDSHLGNIAVEKGDIRGLVDSFLRLKRPQSISEIKEFLRKEEGVDSSFLRKKKREETEKWGDIGRQKKQPSYILTLLLDRFERGVQSADFEREAIKRGIRLSLVDPSMASGYVPHFVSYRKAVQLNKSRTINGKRYSDPTLSITKEASDHPFVMGSEDHPDNRQLNHIFDSLGLPRPVVGVTDGPIKFLSTSRGKKPALYDASGLWTPEGGAFVSGGLSSKMDFLSTAAHETGHALERQFSRSRRGEKWGLGVGKEFTNNTSFGRVVRNEYALWKRDGMNANIPNASKSIFARYDKWGYSEPEMGSEYFAEMFSHLISPVGLRKYADTPAFKSASHILFGGVDKWPFYNMAEGYDPLAQAVARESDAVGAGKVRIGTHPSLKTPHNPMGIGVYNSSEGSLSNGIRMARAVGIDQKTKGMAEGHVPNFAKKISLDNRLDDALATFRMRLEEAGNDMKRRNSAEKDYAKTLKRIQSDAEKRIATTPKAGSASNISEFNQLSVLPDAARAAKRADKLLQSLEKREFDTYGRSTAPQSGQIPMRARSIDDPTVGRGIKVSRPPPRVNFVASEDWRITDEPAVTKASLGEYVNRFREKNKPIPPPSLYARGKEKLKRGYTRAFSYTEEEQKKGKGQGRFGYAFGAQIAGGIARNAFQGTEAEKGVGALADGLDAAATALTLIPGPAGAVAATVAGLGTAIYGFLQDDGPDKLSKSLQKNALEANRSAQALADVTQSYTAYESAMQSRDPVRMTNAMDKLLGKIFQIGEFDPAAMQSALSAIGSTDPREALATAQASIAERQAGIERNAQLFEATRQSSGFWKSGGLGKGGLADSLVSIKQGVSGKDAEAALKKATIEIEANNMAGALQTLEGVIEGGAEAIKAILEGGFGGDIGGVTEADKRQGLSQIAANLGQKTPKLIRLNEFSEALKGPALEVARAQKELAEATRLFGFELSKSSANLKIFSENASRAFGAMMEFRGQEFSSSLDALQEAGRMTEREAITARGVRGSENLITTRNVARNQIGVEGLTEGMKAAKEFSDKAGSGGQKGAGAITQLFKQADVLSQKGDVEGLKNLFSEKSISSLALGSEEARKATTEAIQKLGEDMITKLGVLEADTKRGLDLNAKQVELQAKLYDANLYMKSMWGKGGTQKGTTDITEAIRRIEMARSKGNLTVSEREQLAADLGAVKSESGISYDAKLEKLNKESLNAAFAENIASGNVNNFGGQMTASTQNQIDEKINELRARAGDGSSTAGPQADFMRRFIEARDKGEAAFKELGDNITKSVDLSEVETSFQAVRTESDRLAYAFNELAKRTETAKETELANALNTKNNARKLEYEGIQGRAREKKATDEKRIAELTRIMEAGPVTKGTGSWMDWTGGGLDNSRVMAAENQIRAIREQQKKDADQKTSDDVRLFLDAMKKITEMVTAPTSEGGQSYTSAEVNGAIRVVLATNDLTYEVAQAVKDAISGKTNLIVKDTLAAAMKLLPKL